mmetsp:Transcript_22627/g.37039  ORF Transcript_22627/g.37039 Transcript_22627/m.37039 type:complete len:261 (-) Transcript_22627:2627-3409(-)
MSDPMTNTEVEDVLSSIRRLVSDEKRVEPEADAAPAKDRLVLTPSLRVLDDDTIPDDDNAPELEAVEAVDQHDVDLTDADSSDDPVLLETVVEDDADQETDPPGDDAQHAEPVEAEHPDDASAMRTPETLGEKIAALETLIAGRADEWEPDEPGSDAYAGTEPPAMAWEDAEEDSPDPEPQDVADDAPHFGTASYLDEADDDAPLFSADEDILDEAALRELVSDIVREELQGALGERITRNVRKLVRREIHRALAAQDLE